MNPQPDDDLLAVFARARQCDHEHAPAWCPEVLHRPTRQPRTVLRWIPAALAAACVILLVCFFVAVPKQPTPLSEALPPLLDSPPGELFAGLEPPLLAFEAPSDFLLPPRLNRPTP